MKKVIFGIFAALFYSVKLVKKLLCSFFHQHELNLLKKCQFLTTVQKWKF